MVSSNSENNRSFQLAPSPSSFNLNFGRLRFLDDERGRFQRPPSRIPPLQIDRPTDHSLSRIGEDDALVLIETSLPERALQVGIDSRGPSRGSKSARGQMPLISGAD